MGSTFDPYHAWLGIPTAEQPPHHYRLLGLTLFEQNSDAISHASDRQQSFLRAQKAGEHGVLAKQLIRALQLAERCLLDPEQKAIYDNNLRIALAVTPGSAAASRKAAATARLPIADDSGGLDVSQLVSGDDTTSTAEARPVTVKKSRPRRSEPSAIGRLVAVLLPTGIIAGILMFVGKNFLPSSESPKPADPDAKPGTNVVAKNEPKGTGGAAGAARSTPATAPDSSGKTESSRPPKKATSPTGGLNGSNEGDSSDEANPPRTPNDKKGSVNPGQPPDVTIRPPLFGSGQRPGAEPDERPAVQPRAERLAIPEQAQQDEARKLVVDIFGKELSAAKSPTEKIALANKLLRQAAESKNDPPGCYVLMLIARDLAVDANDLDQLLRTMEVLGATFKVAGSEDKLNALTTFSARGLKPATYKTTAEAALRESRVAGEAEDYDAAIKLARLAYNLVTDKKIEDPKLNKQILAQGKDLVAAQARRAAYLTSLEKLKAQPDDPEANLTAGRGLLFVKQDFAQGSTYLAKGGDPDLKGLAEKENAASQDAAAQVALADEWFELANKTETPAEKNAELRRADYWYRRASPAVVGLTKAKVDKRIAELAGQVVADSTGQPGISAEESKPASETPVANMKTAKDAERLAQRQRTARKALAVYDKFVNDPGADREEREAAKARLAYWRTSADQDLRRIGSKWVIEEDVHRIRGEEKQFLSEAQQAFQQQSYALAEKKFKDAKDLDGDGIVADFQIGLLDALIVRDMNRAASYFEQCVKRRTAHLEESTDTEKSNLAAALNNVAIANVHLRKFSEAFGAWNKALELGPPSREMMQNLGRVYVLSSPEIRAQSDLRLTLNIEPSERKRWDALQTKARQTFGSDGFQSSVGWLFAPFAPEGDAKTTGIVSSAESASSLVEARSSSGKWRKPYEDIWCMACSGSGAVRCPNTGCSSGTVGSFRNETTTFPNGDKVVTRKPIRIPCPVCEGKARVRCPCCTDGTDATLSGNR